MAFGQSLRQVIQDGNNTAYYADADGGRAVYESVDGATTLITNGNAANIEKNSEALDILESKDMRMDIGWYDHPIVS